MNRIIRILGMTATISTGTLIACAVWDMVTLLEKGKSLLEAQIPYVTLWEILLLGIVCTAVTELLPPDAEVSPVRPVLHYVLITASVLVLGYLYGWYRLSISGILLMCLTVAAVYIFSTMLMYVHYKRTADRMTEGLKIYTERDGGE